MQSGSILLICLIFLLLSIWANVGLIGCASTDAPSDNSITLTLTLWNAPDVDGQCKGLNQSVEFSNQLQGGVNHLHTAVMLGVQD